MTLGTSPHLPHISHTLRTLKVSTESFLKRRHGSAKASLKDVQNFSESEGGMYSTLPSGRGAGSAGVVEEEEASVVPLVAADCA